MSSLNYVAMLAPRNAQSSHIVSPASGTVLAGSSFTPTPGRLLVCVAYGDMTWLNPSGWTSPASGSAVAQGALYVWFRIANGNDKLEATHNGTNYSGVVEFHEFEVGSTFSGCAAASGVASAGGAGPTLSSLTGTNDIYYTVGLNVGSNTGGVHNFAWSKGVEKSDLYLDGSGATPADGFQFSTAVTVGSTATSDSASSVVTPTSGTNAERLVWAVKVASAATPPSGSLLTESGNAILLEDNTALQVG